MEVFLWEAGVYSSEHILLADSTILAFVGNMGARQATVLHNYTKRVVLPVLGLRGTYQEDENVDDDPTSSPHTRKRSLNLGESVVHHLYKRPRTEQNTTKFPAPTPPPLLDDRDFDAYFNGEDKVEDDDLEYVDEEKADEEVDELFSGSEDDEDYEI